MNKIQKNKFISMISGGQSVFAGVTRKLVSDSDIQKVLDNISKAWGTSSVEMRDTTKANANMVVFSGGSRLDLNQSGKYTYFSYESNGFTMLAVQHEFEMDFGSEKDIDSKCMYYVVKNEANESVRKVIEAVEEEDGEVGFTSKYSVGNTDGKIFYVGDDPKRAIMAWVKNAKKNSMSISIDTVYRKNAVELISTAVSMEPELEELFIKYKVPYKWEWFKGQIEKKLATKCNTFSENKYHMPDMIFPFDVG